MRKHGADESIDRVRRKLLRASAALGGVFVIGQLPYRRPAIKSFFGTRAAWAQLTGPFTITCSSEASAGLGPCTACQDAIIQNGMAQLSPAPPAGTLIRCTPTTDDPNNATLPDFSTTTSPTDASGKASFAPLNLIGNVPNPPLALGSVLTMTVTFDNPAISSTSCVLQFTIVDCT